MIENFIVELKQREGKFAWIHCNGEVVSPLFDTKEEAFRKVPFNLTKEEREKLHKLIPNPKTLKEEEV